MKNDFIIMKELFEATSISLYTLSKRSHLTNDDLFESLIRLLERGFIVEDLTGLNLTSLGKRKMMRKGFRVKGPLYLVPENMKTSTIECDSGYAPIINKLSKPIVEIQE